MADIDEGTVSGGWRQRARNAAIRLASVVVYGAGCLAVLVGWAGGLNDGDGRIHWEYLPLIPLGTAAVVAAPLCLMGRKRSIDSAIAIVAGLLFAVAGAYA